jgi:hypothetical protein
LLVGLLRHLERQASAGRVVQEHLQGDLNAIGQWGSLGHPSNSPRSGQVASLPGWTFEFHGKGCRLTNDDGTSLDVDFIDGGTARASVSTRRLEFL